MDQLACVNIAALPLQILLRAHPSWSSFPVAVVEDDRPQAPVLYLNTHAHRVGIRSGQRYATALALARTLRAGVIASVQINEMVGWLADRLRRYSPHVEPGTDLPGIFWLDTQGLEGMYPSLRAWADALRIELQNVGMRATVATGFSRFGVYALAMSYRGTVTCESASEENEKVQRVPLRCLNLEPEVRDRLRQLSIVTVGDFLRLPSEGIRTRFGEATEALHRFAAGQSWPPLRPVPGEEVQERCVDFETPESNAERLTFVVKRFLDGIATVLAQQGQAIAGVCLTMKLDDHTIRSEQLRPAAPTLEVAQLLTLIYLRLNTLQLSAGILTLRITAAACPATLEQCRLFTEQARQNAQAIDQAIARIRAECGEHSVVRACLGSGHLPAAQFRWEPLEHVPTQAVPRVVDRRPLVRRIYAKPLSLSSSFKLKSPVNLFSSELLHSRKASGRIFGPFVLSGGWWGRLIHRDYYFLERASGDLWWLYYDRRRKRFFLEGQVQ